MRQDLEEIAAASPGDSAVLLVVADQMEQRGDLTCAALVRVGVALRLAEAHTPAHIDLSLRERALLTSLSRLGAGYVLPEGTCIEAYRCGMPAALRARDPLALLAALPDLPPGITGLALSSPGEPGDLSLLPELPWLESLSLDSGAFFDGDGLQELLDSALLRPGLISLSLARCHLADGDITRLAESEVLLALRSLDLRGNPFGAQGLATLLASPHLRSLRALHIGDRPLALAPLPPDASEALLRWEGLAWIEQLSIPRLGLGREGLPRLFSAAPLLRSLDLSGNALGGVPNIREGSTLSSLGLSECGLGQGDIAALLDAPPLCMLRSLDLSRNPLDPDIGARLVKAPCWTSGALSRLSLAGVPLHRALSPLLEADRGPCVLDASDCRLDNIDLHSLAHAPWIASLRALDLTMNPLSRCAPAIFLRMEELRELRLGPQGDLDFEPPPKLALLEVPSLPPRLSGAHLPDLLSLAIAAPLDGPAFERLCAARWLPQLASLDISRTNLPPEALSRLLTGPPGLRALEQLSIDARGLPSEILEILFDPRVLPALRRLAWRPALPETLDLALVERFFARFCCPFRRDLDTYSVLTVTG